MLWCDVAAFVWKGLAEGQVVFGVRLFRSCWEGVEIRLSSVFQTNVAALMFAVFSRHDMCVCELTIDQYRPMTFRKVILLKPWFHSNPGDDHDDHNHDLDHNYDAVLTLFKVKVGKTMTSFVTVRHVVKAVHWASQVSANVRGLMEVLELYWRQGPLRVPTLGKKGGCFRVGLGLDEPLIVGTSGFNFKIWPKMLDKWMKYSEFL